MKRNKPLKFPYICKECNKLVRNKNMQYKHKAICLCKEMDPSTVDYSIALLDLQYREMKLTNECDEKFGTNQQFYKPKFY